MLTTPAGPAQANGAIWGVVLDADRAQSASLTLWLLRSGSCLRHLLPQRETRDKFKVNAVNGLQGEAVELPLLLPQRQPQNHKITAVKMVSAKEGTDMKLVNVQLRMQEAFRAAIANNTQ